MSPRKLAMTTFTVRVPGITNLVAAPPIPFKGQVIIRRNRSASQLGVYSGGEIIFQGRQITDAKTASRSPANVLTFGDAWWDLEQTTFQQQWKCWTASDGHIGEALSQPFCRVNLFQDFSTGFYITNGATITEIINWAIGCGVKLQVGTVDLHWFIQPYPATALSCASAIQICLKPTPGCACWIDMSTNPPTFHCRERDYHEAMSLPYGSQSHQGTDITPRYDMQVPQVVIQYQQSATVTADGKTRTWTQFYYDAWPPDDTLPAAVRGGKQVSALVVPIQLADYSRTDLVQTVVSGEFGSPPSLDWWKGKKPALRAYSNLVYVPNSLKILDTTGADITSTVLETYPNELIDGAAAAWMHTADGSPVGIMPVTVQGAFTYSEQDAQGRVWHTVGPGNPHVVSVNTRLTNSPIGQASYSIIQSLDTGQTPVANLAQAVWTLLNWLFWDGTHSIVERNSAGAPEVSRIIDSRYALNLTGGMTAWVGMLSPVHGTEIDFQRGTTEIRFGLPRGVGPAELEELLQFYKWRLVLRNPNLQSSGNAGFGNGEVGGSAPRENTSDSKAPPALHITASPINGGTGQTQIVHDPDAQEIRIKAVDASGSLISGFPSVSLKLEDLQYA